MGKVSPGQVRQGSLGQTRADVLNSVTKPIGPVACSLPMLGKFVPSKFSHPPKTYPLKTVALCVALPELCL